jgi:hypothetical protein
MKNTRRLVSLALACLLALTSMTDAGWDKTKPPTNGAAVSADIRANWASIETAVGGVNLLADPTFLIWAAGDAAAPTHWVFTGAGATIARTGTGLGDTNRKVGPYAAKVTAGGGAVAVLEQQLLTTTSFDASFQGRSVSMGAWVRCTAGSAGRIRIVDGVNTSYSAFHTGGSTFEWLTISGHSISGSATRLTAAMEVAVSQACHLSGPTFVLGDIPPAQYMPAPVVYQVVNVFLAGNATVAVTKYVAPIHRPSIVKDVQLMVFTTAPTGADLIVDVQGGAGTMFTAGGRPKIVATQAQGGAQPDSATYSRKCFSGMFGGGALTNDFLRVNVDQIGATLPGTDLAIQIRLLQYARPLEAFLAFNEIS